MISRSSPHPRPLSQRERGDFQDTLSAGLPCRPELRKLMLFDPDGVDTLGNVNSDNAWFLGTSGPCAVSVHHCANRGHGASNDVTACSERTWAFPLTSSDDSLEPSPRWRRDPNRFSTRLKETGMITTEKQTEVKRTAEELYAQDQTGLRSTGRFSECGALSAKCSPAANRSRHLNRRRPIRRFSNCSPSFASRARWIG